MVRHVVRPPMPRLIEQLRATRWDRFLTSGRNQPALVACDLVLVPGELEFVVKLNSTPEGLQLHAPVCEAMASMLARDLGLPVADPCLVEITEEWVESIDDESARKRCSESLGFNFACRFFGPGWSRVAAGKSLGKASLQTMAEVFAFDIIIQNIDRRSSNPNYLASGSDIRIFDHEMAFDLFNLAGETAFAKPAAYSLCADHVFTKPLKGCGVNLEKFFKSFGKIPKARLDDYILTLPDSWPGKTSYAEKIRKHILRAQASIPRISQYSEAHLSK
jgi:hypothetical protein